MINIDIIASVQKNSAKTSMDTNEKDGILERIRMLGQINGGE